MSTGAVADGIGGGDRETVYAPVRAKQPPPTPGTFLKRLLGVYPRLGPVRPEAADADRPLTEQPLPAQSFMPYVPFWRYEPESGQFVAADTIRRAVLFELLPVDIEGRPVERIDEVAERVTVVLEDLPEADPPWVVQIYMQDESKRSLTHEIWQYIDRYAGETQYSQYWIEVLKEHFNLLGREGGVFHESRSDLPWRARYRRVRVILYRAPGVRVEPDDLTAVALRFKEGLREAGVRAVQGDGDALREWLLPWYSGQGKVAWDYLDQNPYPVQIELDNQLPPDFDLGEICLFGQRPKLTEDYWQLGNRFTRFLTLQPYRSIPRSGFWNRSGSDEGQAGPFDKLPDGSILTYTLCVEPQDTIKGRIERTIKASIGGGEDALASASDSQQALKWMAQGNRLITWLGGIYVSADSPEALRDATRRVQTVCGSVGYQTIDPEEDLVGADIFLRALPMGFRPRHDARRTRRARLGWESHLGRLMPFYGKGTGTGNPGALFFNRIGEPVLFDPFCGEDRIKNAHAIILGPTGSGKTATLVHILSHTLAVHRPRVFLITLLPTFYLLADHLERHGLSVHRVRITHERIDAPLCPFADAINIDSDDSQRDYLSEATTAAIMMITGGDLREREHLRRQDEALIGEGIVHAARQARSVGREQVLTSDVVTAYRAMSTDSVYTGEQKNRLLEFAAAMGLMTQGNDGRIFDRLGEVWPDADITVVELGYFGRAEHQGRLAIATMGLLQHVNAIVEANQASGRYTLTVIDEAHQFLKNPMVGPYLNNIAAMWRTFGGWLWLATQNLRQVPETCKELLNQPEWWLCLSSGKDEVAQIARFRELTKEQESLLQSATKEPGKFTEGVVMSERLLTLFRNVPPALSLALAQTELKERTRRLQLAESLNISELDAAYRIADEIRQAREEPA